MPDAQACDSSVVLQKVSGSIFAHGPRTQTKDYPPSNKHNLFVQKFVCWKLILEKSSCVRDQSQKLGQVADVKLITLKRISLVQQSKGENSM